MMPECMLQNMAQPQRKPITGEYVSFRKTYTPPACGNADASSAQQRAPKSVSKPATIHAANTAGTEGTKRVISAGWTKIDAPMIVPTAIAVAWTKAIERFSSAILVDWRA